MDEELEDLLGYYRAYVMDQGFVPNPERDFCKCCQNKKTTFFFYKKNRGTGWDYYCFDCITMIKGKPFLKVEFVNTEESVQRETELIQTKIDSILKEPGES